MNASQGNDSYEHLYGSVLMDELHNYFPQILYNPEQFGSVRSLLDYVNQQARTRFNPYEVGRRRAARVARAASPNGRAPAAAAAPINAPEIIDTFIYQMPLRPAAAPLRTGATNNLMNLFLQELVREEAAAAAAGAGFEEAVPVRPSADVIMAATTLVSFSENTVLTDNTCAICQDDFSTGNTLRRLNQCNHHFHRACIDSWFMTNPRCPVCRADIRERPAAEAGAGAGSHQPL